jgi:hypothetical protein
MSDMAGKLRRAATRGICLAAGLVGPHLLAADAEDAHFGFLFDHHKLTLESGTERQAAGPFYWHRQWDTSELFAVPPFYSHVREKDKEVDAVEWDALYPVVSYDRFGPEYRWHLFQVLSWAGSESMDGEHKRRLTLYPFYFSQRADNPTNNYWALLPFYGHVQNRLFRDEVDFVMLPAYLKSRKRDVVTRNYLFPIFHLREGNHLAGWQVWPLVGHERKVPYTTKDGFGDDVKVGGHNKWFVGWPFFNDATTDIGTENPSHKQAFIPLYAFERSPHRDYTSYLWPLGFTFVDDRERKYREKGLPWPFVVFARGEGKTMDRVWPFYSHGITPNQQSDQILWPVYSNRRFHSAELDREKLRILMFLYADITEKHLENGEYRRRTALWPLFTHQKDEQGRERLQVLAPLEPFVDNKSIERNWSPLWALWRAEKNPKTEASSQSVLWNLYRHERTPETRKTSLLFGMFQWQSGPEGRKARVLFIPFGKRK